MRSRLVTSQECGCLLHRSIGIARLRVARAEAPASRFFTGHGVQVIYGREIPLCNITTRRKLLHGAVAVPDENAVLGNPSIYNPA